jgi:hypothetical protein
MLTASPGNIMCPNLPKREMVLLGGGSFVGGGCFTGGSGWSEMEPGWSFFDTLEKTSLSPKGER